MTPGEGSSSYAYLSDGALNETTIRGQVLVLWPLRPLVEPGDPALYRYRLPDEREANRQLKIGVRMPQLRNGVPYWPALSVVPVTTLVDVAVVRSVREQRGRSSDWRYPLSTYRTSFVCR